MFFCRIELYLRGQPHTVYSTDGKVDGKLQLYYTSRVTENGAEAVVRRGRGGGEAGRAGKMRRRRGGFIVNYTESFPRWVI
jgi:hypothetical protein